MYWAIDLDGQRAVTHTAPLDGRYTRVDVVDAGGELVSAELGIRIPLPELFAAAAR